MHPESLLFRCLTRMFNPFPLVLMIRYRADVRKRREEARREKEKMEKDGSEHPDETQHEEKASHSRLTLARGFEG